MAAAAEGGQETRLEREVDRLSPRQRTELERQVADGLARAGLDLGDPAVQAKLADTLGVPLAEIERIAASAAALSTTGTVDISSPIVLLFLAAALIFLPSIFKSIADTIFGGDGAAGGIDGVEPF